MNSSAPASLRTLTERYDPAVFEHGRSSARVRLDGAGPVALDFVIDGDGGGKLVAADVERRPDALLSADEQTWESIANDVRGGMAAFRAGRLRVRHDLHLGVGFLAATAGAAPSEAPSEANGARGGGLRFRRIATKAGTISICEAGTGPPVLLVHGLGATKVSFLPTLAALAPTHRPIAVDLPGFGDSDKPVLASYDAKYFASSMSALLDALEIERADVIGNSMGGRVAIEIGLRTPERVNRLALLAPSLAWLRPRPWAPYLRWVAPQLGLIQPAPRAVVEAIVKRVIPRSDEEWTAAGIDEFLRSYLTPRGRAAFYAAARSIYMEEPHGPSGFWTRLPELQPQSLWVWGRQDPLVPIGFARHVREALPDAKHVELNCGHVPQLERPRETHDALVKFLRR